MTIPIDTWVKFFGIWIAEGSFDNNNIAKSHGYRVVIAQHKSKTRNEIRDLLNEMPFSYREEEDVFIIYNKQLWTYLKQFGKAKDKYLPGELKKLTFPQLKQLFKWMVKGDGHVRPLRGIAKINQIRRLVGKSREKAVFRSTGHVNDVFVLALLVCRTGSSGHDVGIDIDRIDRIGYGNYVGSAENFLKIAGIALCAVTNEDFRFF